MIKLGTISIDEDKEYKYRNEYAIQKTKGPERLIISTCESYIDLAYDLIENIADKFGILYVLTVSRIDNRPGRYQLADMVNKKELEMFCTKYSKYLESDGRHHLWIASTYSNDLIVYDHHNVLYAYGDIEQYIEILEHKNFQKVNEILFPCPHTHNYNRENDITENEIISSNKWMYFPLEKSDDY
jgi:hypothetical protein